MIIAIDGPSGAGKSSVARAVAERLGFAYLDTGAMYRSVALQALEQGVDLSDDEALGRLAEAISLRFEPIPDATTKVFADDVDVTDEIRTDEVDKAVSPVSAAPSVRAAMTEEQRRIGASGDYVVEGRDIATTVFPNAAVKVFLTASPEERARRRCVQNRERGVGVTDYDELLEAIRRRDDYDSGRASSPLRAAEDARRLDSTGLTFDEVVDQIVAWAQAVQE